MAVCSQCVTRPVLAVFGGSFDPPHIGHVMLPTYLLTRGLAERVMVAVSFAHPFGKTQSSFDERLTWTRLAMRDHGPRVEISDIERELAAARPGPTYTIDLLESVSLRWPAHEIRLVIGSDLVEGSQASRWHRWSEIERRFSPIVVPRRVARDEPGLLPAISSTLIRSWLARAPDPSAVSELERHVPAIVLERLLERASPKPITVVGRGHAGVRITQWLGSRGFAPTSQSSRAIMADPSRLAIAPGCAAIWLLCSDDQLENMAAAIAGTPPLPAGLPVLSGSGSRVARQVLAPVVDAGHPVGTLHPICSLRREHAHAWLDHAGFGVEGDPAARAIAHEIVGDNVWLDLQGHDATSRTRYHAACSLAANHLAVLFGEAHRVLSSLHHPPSEVGRCLAALMTSAMDNLTHLGLPHGVTGPIARGDNTTASTHARALGGDAGALYETLASRLRQLLLAENETQ